MYHRSEPTKAAIRAAFAPAIAAYLAAGGKVSRFNARGECLN